MGFKSVEVLQGDTLQRLSLREMGNADRWVDIAILNNLSPPYLTDDQSAVTDGVVLSGSLILVPIIMQYPLADTYDVFLTDLSLTGGVLGVEYGDFSLISGISNFLQAIKNRVDVRKRSLWFHPEYGCWIHSLIGAINGPAAGGMAAFYVKSAILEDERVSSVKNITATVLGDSISVECIVMPVYGESIAYRQVI